MARKPRDLEAGAFHHVTARGNHKQVIYLTDVDRHQFMGLLKKTVETYEWRLHSYCLMTNHFHLLVSTKDCNLDRGMQFLKSNYARLFNKTYGLEGHLFLQRYWSHKIEHNDHLVQVVRYIALNPVRAGLCLQPEAWRWSSYPAAVGVVPAPEFLTLSLLQQEFGSTRQIERFINDGLISFLPVPGRSV
jgi:REP-associated tyrosine transposase